MATKTKEPRTTTYDGFRFHLLETEKYKTTTIAVNLKRKIEPENVTKRALLSQVLKSGTKSYPSSLHIHRFLEDMYGAGFSSSVTKKGTYQIISIRMDVSNERYLLEQDPLLEKALAFLAEVVLHPLTDGDRFDEKIVQKEKRVLKQRIQSIYDDKMRYANKRLIEEMFKDDVYAHHAYGKEEEVDSITSSDLYAYYRDVINHDDIDVYIIGDVDGGKVEGIVKDNFTFSTRELQEGHDQPEYEPKRKENVVFDEQDVKQGKLHIGYRTPVTFSDSDYYAMQVFNGVFGGFSHSKLFINVREKASLAYYAVSRMESHIGAIFVMSGIEFKNYEKAVKIIREQMDHMKNGKITEDELNQTKEMLRNQILESIDSPNGWMELLYHSQVSGIDRTIDEWLEGISTVTMEEVVKVAEKVSLDTIYFLKGEGQ